jgi:hypothetical protein
MPVVAFPVFPKFPEGVGLPARDSSAGGRNVRAMDDDGELYEMPLDPSVRTHWRVGEHFQVMLDMKRGIDYEVVSIDDLRMLCRRVEEQGRRKPTVRERIRRRLSALAE